LKPALLSSARDICLAIAIVTSSACSLAVDHSSVQSEVSRFHDQFNDDDAQGIYESADESFRKAVGREEFFRFLTQIRERLGRFVRQTERAYSAQTQVGSTASFVKVTYASVFSGGEATETFTWRLAGGKPTLVAYDIR
jgi:hypothetical protein